MGAHNHHQANEAYSFHAQKEGEILRQNPTFPSHFCQAMTISKDSYEDKVFISLQQIIFINASFCIISLLSPTIAINPFGSKMELFLSATRGYKSIHCLKSRFFDYGEKE